MHTVHKAHARSPFSTESVALIFAMLAAQPIFAGPAALAEVDEQSMQVLETFSAAISNASGFEVNVKEAWQVEDPQEYEVVREYALAVQRPNRAKLVLKRGRTGASIFCDGESVLAYGEARRDYTLTSAPAALAGLMCWEKLGRAYTDVFTTDLLEFLLAEKPAEAIVCGLVSGAYAGTAQIDGTQCHHLVLTYRAIPPSPAYQLDVYLESGGRGLLRRTVGRDVGPDGKAIGGANMVATVDYVNWMLDPEFPADYFQLKVPAERKRIEIGQIPGSLQNRLRLREASTRSESADGLIETLLAMAAPAPDWEAQARKRNESLPIPQRDWFEGPPPADAAIGVLLPYWAGLYRFDGEEPPQLPEMLREKLLHGCEQRPEWLPGVLPFLSESDDACQRVAQLHEDDPRTNGFSDEYWRTPVLEWLAQHCDAYRPQLVEMARAAADRDGWVENETALRALAARDWPTAETILKEYARGDQPIVAAISAGLLYKHAAQAGKSEAAAELRKELQRLVSTNSAPQYAQAEACAALMDTDWPGRNEWFLAQFAVVDPAVLAPVVGKSPDYWIPRVSPLVGAEDLAAHNAAVHCLAQFNLEDARADALRPHLPWLENPDWAKTGSRLDRLRLIQSMDRVELPESVEGLLWVAAHEDGARLRGAADALVHYQSNKAAPVLKAAIARASEEYYRRPVIRAVAELGGFVPDEIVAYVEAFTTFSAAPDAAERMERAQRSYGEKQPLDPELSIGWYLCRAWEHPDEEAARRLIARVRDLETSDSPYSQNLWLAICEWRTRATDQEFVRRLASGSVEELAIRAVLHQRKSFRDNAREALESLVEQGGAVSGVAAALLGEPARCARILEQGESAACQGLLACARLAREPLPVELVGRLLETDDAQLIRAAELYLESNDSPAARRRLLARHPGEALILGACREFDGPVGSSVWWPKWEPRLQQMVLDENGPDEVVALLSSGNWGSVGQIVIGVRNGNAEITYFDDDDETKQARVLAAEEWRSLHAFLTANAIDDLAPMETSVQDGIQYEYVHLNRDGGRRVYMNNPDTVGGCLYDQLVERITALADSLRKEDPQPPSP